MAENSQGPLILGWVEAAWSIAAALAAAFYAGFIRPLLHRIEKLEDRVDKDASEGSTKRAALHKKIDDGQKELRDEIHRVELDNRRE